MSGVIVHLVARLPGDEGDGARGRLDDDVGRLWVGVEVELCCDGGVADPLAVAAHHEQSCRSLTMVDFGSLTLSVQGFMLITH